MGRGRKARKDKAHAIAGTGGEGDMPLFSGTHAPRVGHGETALSNVLTRTGGEHETDWGSTSISDIVRGGGTSAPPLLPDFRDEDEDEDGETVDRREHRYAQNWAALADKMLQGKVPFSFPLILLVLIGWGGGVMYFLISRSELLNNHDGRVQSCGTVLLLASVALLLISVITMRMSHWRSGVVLSIGCLACLGSGIWLLQ